jgi:hypothetical protein
MASLQKELRARLLELTDVEEKKSRFSGELAYFRGKKEFAHFHSAQEIDIRVGKRQIRAGRDTFLAHKRVRRENPQGDWLVVQFRREADLELVLQLAFLAWKNSV